MLRSAVRLLRRIRRTTSEIGEAPPRRWAEELDEAGLSANEWIGRRQAAPRLYIGLSHDAVTHLRTEYSTFTWILEPMLERAGFSIRRRSFSESMVFAEYVCERTAD